MIRDETIASHWVIRYELVKNFELKKDLVGVGISWIKGRDGNTKLWRGENPFCYFVMVIFLIMGFRQCSLLHFIL